jgi:hypothetical protein
MSVLLSWLDAAGAEASLEIDGTPSRGYESAADITEHPVETGTAVADHIRPLNPTITLEGIISNAPVLVPSGQLEGATRAAASKVLPSGQKVTTQQWSGTFDRKAACDRLLLALVEGGVLVTLTTPLRVTESLAIARYKVDEFADTGDALALTLELRRVRVVSTVRVAVPAVRRLQVQAERGAQPVDDRSLLARALDGGAPVTAAQDRAARQRQGVRP